MEQQILSTAQHQEQEMQRPKDQTTAQPDHIKTRWKQQISQKANYKAEIHAQKSELEAILSAKMISVEAPRPTVEAEQRFCRAPQSMWLTVVDKAELIGDTDETDNRTRASYGPPSPETQCYNLGTTRPHVKAQRQHDGPGSQVETQDLFQGDAPRIWELDDDSQMNKEENNMMQSADELQTAVSSCAIPPTPSSSSMDGPRCLGGCLVRPSCLGQPPGLPAVHSALLPPMSRHFSGESTSRQELIAVGNSRPV